MLEVKVLSSDTEKNFSSDWAEFCPIVKILNMFDWPIFFCLSELHVSRLSGDD